MIEKFRGENFYLSNMYFLDNWITTEQGLSVPTSEHAYQSAKFLDKKAHSMVANAVAKDILDARIYADGLASKETAHSLIERGYETRSDFLIARNGIMLAALAQKFLKNKNLAERLIRTGDELIVEGNDWGDRYWGIDPIGSDNGENHLGKLIMTVRTGLQEGTIFDEHFVDKHCQTEN